MDENRFILLQISKLRGMSKPIKDSNHKQLYMRSLIRNYDESRVHEIIKIIDKYDDLILFRDLLIEVYQYDTSGLSKKCYFDYACKFDINKFLNTTFPQRENQLKEEQKIMDAAKNYIEDLKTHKVLYKKIRKWIKIEGEDYVEQFREVPAHRGFTTEDKYIDYAIREVCIFYFEGLRGKKSSGIYIENDYLFSSGHGFQPSLSFKISLCLFYVVMRCIIPREGGEYIHKHTENDDELSEKMLDLLDEYYDDAREEIVKLVDDNISKEERKREVKEFSNQNSIHNSDSDVSEFVLSQSKFDKLKELLVGKTGKTAAIIIQASLICGVISHISFEKFVNVFGSNIIKRTMYYKYIGLNKYEITDLELDPVKEIFDKID